MRQPVSSGWDAIIVGGGHNGLVCATLLGKRGRRVLVLEAGPQLGGSAQTGELAGARVPAGAHLVPTPHPGLVRALDLERHGLRIAMADVPTTSLLPEGDRLTLSADEAGTMASLARLSLRDAQRFPDFQARLRRMAGALRPFLLATPPRLRPDHWGDRMALLRIGLATRRLGQHDMRELMRIVAMNAADLVEDSFESDALRGILAFDSVLGSAHGPRSPNTVFALLMRAAAATEEAPSGLCLPQGGAAGFVAAIAAAVRAAGATVRRDAPVARITVDGDRTTGVVLADGDEIAAPLVVSNADPRRTLVDLVGPDHLDADFLKRVRGIRMAGVTAKLNLVLDAPPPFPDVGAAELRGRLVVAPSVNYVERAFDSSKYGEMSERPALEITVPTAADPSLAPEGRHVVSVVAQFAPYQLRDGGWDAMRDTLGDRIVAVLEEHAPGISARVVAREVLAPTDVEARFGAGGGHWHHGDLALDQVFLMRPVPGWAQYRMPIEGLYLCGAGTHPGGGLTGLPGLNAARQILAEPKVRR